MPSPVLRGRRRQNVSVAAAWRTVGPLNEPVAALHVPFCRMARIPLRLRVKQQRDVAYLPAEDAGPPVRMTGAFQKQLKVCVQFLKSTCLKPSRNGACT
eukprot:6074645-Pleurochrysis_carterae.AAC.3